MSAGFSVYHGRKVVQSVLLQLIFVFANFPVHIRNFIVFRPTHISNNMAVFAMFDEKDRVSPERLFELAKDAPAFYLRIVIGLNRSIK